MMKRREFITLLGGATRTTIVISAALALAVTLPAVQAQAQSIRTFVSTAGSDSNPCSLAAPCRHFQAAVNATALRGELDPLHPAPHRPLSLPPHLPPPVPSS